MTDSFQLPQPTIRKQLILIVDDLPENLQVLAGHLSGQGYEVMPSSSGERALAIVRNRRPDLILLDVNMPDPDGFAVCEALKQDPETANIPVIFITARVDSDDVIRGLTLGAADYVTKPFKATELIARVRTHLELKHSRDLLLTYNRELQRISQSLRQLNEEKNRLVSVVSHDIRNAFGNVIVVAELVATGSLGQAEAVELLNDIGEESEHMITLAENLLNLDAIEAGGSTLNPQPVDTAGLLTFVLKSNQIASRARNLKFELPQESTVIFGDLTACRQILNNLLSNAIKFSPPGGLIRIEVVPAGEAVAIRIVDQGPGISEENQKKLFTAFTRLTAATTTTRSTHSIGLGLSIVRRMSESMGGTAGCESTLGKGSTFYVTLPKAPAAGK